MRAPCQSVRHANATARVVLTHGPLYLSAQAIVGSFVACLGVIPLALGLADADAAAAAAAAAANATSNGTTLSV